MKSNPSTTPGRDAYDYVAMLRRMVKAAPAKVHDTEQLAALAGIADFLEEAIQAAVDQLRDEGFTWQSIGEAFGVTRQRAIQRWSHR